MVRATCPVLHVIISWRDSRQAPKKPYYDWHVPELQRLRGDHAPMVLAFELANRSYFATTISDRGDEYFHTFAELHYAQVAEQESGACLYFVLVDEDGTILGRFNLYEIHDGTANVGYRVAENVAGRGVGTATLRELCRIAATTYGLQSLSAAVAVENIASQRVLAKNGFVPDGPAELAGHAGTWYRRTLSEN